MASAGFAAANGWLWQRAFNSGDSALATAAGGELAPAIEPDLVQTPILQDAEGVLESLSAADKVRFFEQAFADDVYLADEERPLLHSVLLRLERVQKVIGYGNFNLVSFDDMLKTARAYTVVGAFTAAELAFMEKLFCANARQYGFFGDKVIADLTANFRRGDVVKVSGSGNYLYNGDSLAHYEKLRKQIGPTVILTSGIRSNVKQIALFLTKTASSGYNLSKASRSLAPPGHSYHGIGDYDVGKVGLGEFNFTDKFAETDEFKRMQDLGYIEIRYTRDNHLGVRFEPWHIKVV
jgi:hypothetical protein